MMAAAVAAVTEEEVRASEDTAVEAPIEERK